MPECQTDGLNPKNSLNFFSNSAVNPISGNSIKACLFFSKISNMCLKYTMVFPEPVVPCNK